MTVMNSDQLYLEAKKRIKDLKGFYTHVFATFIILPFLITLNLKLDPQFHWFWFAIIAWCLGLFIHGLVVFLFNNNANSYNWKIKKMEEILEEKIQANKYFTQENFYIEAKKKAKEIKGFYVHLIINVFAIPNVVYVNLKFVPEFHFFWFAAGGMLIALLLHWFGVFGLEFFGIGKNWEEKKMKEFVNKKHI